MIRLVLILILVWTSTVQAKIENCSWDNDVPCVTIVKPNNNIIIDLFIYIYIPNKRSVLL